MAAKAAERRELQAAEERRAEVAEFQRRAWAEIDWLAEMPQCPFDPEPPWIFDPWVLQQTLGEATARLSPDRIPFGCACHGPPNCCVNVYAAARLLRRDAHIVAKLLTGLRDQHPAPQWSQVELDDPRLYFGEPAEPTSDFTVERFEAELRERLKRSR
jgi:hypothetical protein